MNDNFGNAGIAIVVVFGAVIVGGLMAASIGFGQLDGFLFALGAATTAWVAGHAMIFNRPRSYGALVIASVLLAAASTLTIIY